MSANHTLRMVIVGTKFDRIEDEAIEHVARYTGWTLRSAHEWVERHATITAEPIDRVRGRGVRWRAVVEVTV
jgi:hypothetical protein